MELQNLERDVQTLRKLYGLLRFCKNSSQCACSEWYLDESAKIFFENLLDAATEMVFEAYSKVLTPPFSPKNSPKVAQSSCPAPSMVSDFPSAILQRKLIGKIETSPTSKPRGTRAIEDKCVPNQMTTWPTMPDQKPSKSSSKCVAQRTSQRESKSRSSSSSWTSQEDSSHTYGQGDDTGSTSSSDSEGYSMSSSSESEEYPLSDQVKMKKHTSGFRRLKDKLALVFHHHHHHHHHHGGGGGDHRDQKTKAGRDTSLWKNAGKKIFHGKHKDEAYGEQAADQHRKSMVCKVADKNQHVNFHNLVKGILGQLRKSKVSKGDIKRLGDGRRGGKKGAMKLSGLKLLRLQKDKINRSKPRVKVEFGSKNPMFKTLGKTR